MTSSCLSHHAQIASKSFHHIIGKIMVYVKKYKATEGRNLFFFLSQVNFAFSKLGLTFFNLRKGHSIPYNCMLTFSSVHSLISGVLNVVYFVKHEWKLCVSLRIFVLQFKLNLTSFKLFFFCFQTEWCKNKDTFRLKKRLLILFLTIMTLLLTLLYFPVPKWLWRIQWLPE